MSTPHLLYLRRSRGRRTIAKQRSTTTGYLAAHDGHVHREFTDADRTAFRKVDGAQPGREGFTAMLAELRANPGIPVAAWHADRLTRNDEDTAELIRVCSAGGHLVVTVSGGTYDLSTANGRRRFRDDASAAIYEVDHGRERTMEGRAVVVAEGRWLGGRPPFGWEPDPDPPLGEDGEPWTDDDGKLKRGILRLREPEAGALRKAALDVIAGRGGGSIEREWREAGIRNAAGNPFRWGEIRRFLLRPRNAGLMESGGQVTGKAHWPPVMDEPTWRAAVAVLGDPSRRSTPGPARRHLLSFIARCETCGGPVTCGAGERGAGGRRRKVYRCRQAGHVTRDAGHLDELIAGLVIARLSRPDAKALLERPDDGRREALAGLYARKADAERLIAEQIQLHVDEVITTAELAEGRRQLRARLEEIDRQIAEVARQDVLTPLIGDPAGVWETLDLDQRRAVVRALMTITLKKAPQGRPAGWKPGQPYFRRESVDITWLR